MQSCSIQSVFVQKETEKLQGMPDRSIENPAVPVGAPARGTWRTATMLLALPALLLLLSIGAGCATVPANVSVVDNVSVAAVNDGADEDFDAFDDFDIPETPPARDPLRVYNRFMFKVNDKAYTWVLKPVAKGYRWVLPEPVRASVQKCAHNLGFPVRFINSGLQGNFKGAGVELVRFGINSTVGILGLFDPAASTCGLRPSDEDFGQTLGRYGVGPGWPLVLPLLGQTNLRDALGMVPDYFLHPFSYIEPTETSLAVQGIEKENYISLHMDEYDAVREDAFDLYTFMRDAYRQKREAEIEE